MLSLFLTYVCAPCAGNVDAAGGKELDTKLVHRGAEAFHWRHGIIRGGTPAEYDADFDGYVAFFHSTLYHDSGRTRTYFMGCYIFAAQPPFALQLVSKGPLVGPAFYDDTHSRDGLRVIFPAGLLVTREAIVISYGRNDNGTRIVRFDRQKLAGTLGPPLPESWNGSACI